MAAEEYLPTDESNMRVKSRIVYLPLAFEDSVTLDAVKRGSFLKEIQFFSIGI